MFNTAEFERYRQMLREEMNMLSDAAVANGPLEQENYLTLVGKVHGIALAERLLLDLAEAYQEQEKNE